MFLLISLSTSPLDQTAILLLLLLLLITSKLCYSSWSYDSSSSLGNQWGLNSYFLSFTNIVLDCTIEYL